MEQIRIVKEMRENDRRSNGRTGRYVRPRYMVWENVPGAFSSNSGKDFQAVLTEIARIADPDAPDVPLFGGGKKWDKAGCLYDEMGRWSIAWRVHDAQFWGVPQRRKRIALVADFGGMSAPEILFERKGLSRDIEQGEQEGEETPDPFGRSSDKTGERVISFDPSFSKNYGGTYFEDVAKTLTPGTAPGHHDGVATAPFATAPQSYTLKVRGGAERDRYGKKAGKGALIQEEKSGTLGVSQDQTLITTEPVLLESNQNHATVQTNGISTALPAAMGEGGGYVPMVTVPLEGNGARPSHHGDGYGEAGEAAFTLNAVERHAVAYGISAYESNSMKSSNPHSGIYPAETSRTLDLNGGNPACNQGGVAVVEKCLNPWDVQSKHIQPENGIAESLYSGECRYGGGESYVLAESDDT